ncbi:unnamed protein product [Strongylus vulgaris]|uniref:Uncharacterized protein n=1 Tax=Strongylus vulgaris TaxID=40348 RepID=A0A3P7KY96_STRVU|nr:unnamed protein product [Strongylus vulgaris]
MNSTELFLKDSNTTDAKWWIGWQGRGGTHRQGGAYRREDIEGSGEGPGGYPPCPPPHHGRRPWGPGYGHGPHRGGFPYWGPGERGGEHPRRGMNGYDRRRGPNNSTNSGGPWH